MIKTATTLLFAAVFLFVLGLSAQARQGNFVATAVSPVVNQGVGITHSAAAQHAFQDRRRPDNRSQVQHEASDERPGEYRLEQNYPNPFNPVTMMRYALPEGAQVNISVYNALGQQVRILVNQYQDAGTYRVEWDGRDDGGKVVPSGLYLYRLETPAFTQTRRMMFVK